MLYRFLYHAKNFNLHTKLLSVTDLQRNAFCKIFFSQNIMHVSKISHAKWRNACSIFRSKLARKRKPAPETIEYIHDCLRWNASHAQASLEFRPLLVTHRHWWIVYRRREFVGKASSFFSPTYTATTGVQKCPICPFPRATNPTSLVSSHPKYRASLITGDGQKATPLLLYDEYSSTGRLKIQVLYSYLVTFVRVSCCVRMYVRKLLDRSFQREVFA